MGWVTAVYYQITQNRWWKWHGIYVVSCYIHESKEHTQYKNIQVINSMYKKKSIMFFTKSSIFLVNLVIPKQLTTIPGLSDLSNGFFLHRKAANPQHL